MKTEFRSAWSQCRAMNWGTLHFSFSSAISAACRAAFDSRRQSVFPLRQRLSLRRRGVKYHLPA